MTIEEIWEAFVSETGVSGEYDSWMFGAEPDELADLVKKGIKTGTSSYHPSYQYAGELLPESGQYSIVLDSQEEPVCIIQTKTVSILPYQAVTADHAYKEGEGDRSLAYWQAVHQPFFEKEAEAINKVFKPTDLIVYEEFECVYSR